LKFLDGQLYNEIYRLALTMQPDANGVVQFGPAFQFAAGPNNEIEFETNIIKSYGVDDMNQSQILIDDETMVNDIENEEEEDRVLNETINNSSWLEAPTKLLLHSYNDMHKKVGKSIKLKTKSKMCTEITKKLTDRGYNFTEQQVQNKFRALERTFKQKTANNKKTGRGRTICKFEKYFNINYFFYDYTNFTFFLEN
jgi:hypothetical protein